MRKRVVWVGLPGDVDSAATTVYLRNDTVRQRTGQALLDPDVMGRGLRLALGGLALGTVLVLVAFRLLASILCGISPTDPITLIEMAVVIVAATILASCLPARRAMSVNPVDALRQE
jgi:Mg/Co/Ni transporter MgtE